MLQNSIPTVCGSHSEGCWRSPSLCWGHKDTPTQSLGALVQQPECYFFTSSPSALLRGWGRGRQGGRHTSQSPGTCEICLMVSRPAAGPRKSRFMRCWISLWEGTSIQHLCINP